MTNKLKISLSLIAFAWLLVLTYVLAHRDEPQDHVTVNRLSDSSISVECNDEREPVITRYANTTHITVTCEAQ